MPNIASAKKRMRQSEQRRHENRVRKSLIKTARRRTEEALQEGKADQAQEAFRLMQKKADKAAKHNTIHPNKAARRKSRMQKKINALKAKQG